MIKTKTKEDRIRFYQSREWRQLRKQILERDHYECQWCADEGKVTNHFEAVLEVDHIQELEHYPELALEMTNLRTLCKECHNKRHRRFQFRKEQTKIGRLFRSDEWWGSPPSKKIP